MNTTKRIVLWTLIAALTIATVPLWGRTALPCLYMRQYLIVYSAWHAHVPPAWAQILPPGDLFQRFPPRCMDLPGGRTNPL